MEAIPWLVSAVVLVYAGVGRLSRRSVGLQLRRLVDENGQRGLECRLLRLERDRAEQAARRLAADREAAVERAELAEQAVRVALDVGSRWRQQAAING
jgi:hypothetical protein